MSERVRRSYEQVGTTKTIDLADFAGLCAGRDRDTKKLGAILEFTVRNSGQQVRLGLDLEELKALREALDSLAGEVPDLWMDS